MGGYDEESLEASSTASSGSEESEHQNKKTGVSPDGNALRPIAGQTPMEILAGGIAGASVVSAAAAMILQPANIVSAAGGLSWYVFCFLTTLLRPVHITTNANICLHI